MAEMDLAKEDERPTQEPMRPRLEAPERRNLDTDDNKKSSGARSLFPSLPAVIASTPPRATTWWDQTGQPDLEPYTSPSLALPTSEAGPPSSTSMPLRAGTSTNLGHPSCTP